jgi:hypothetical protein
VASSFETRAYSALLRMRFSRPSMRVSKPSW